MVDITHYTSVDDIKEAIIEEFCNPDSILRLSKDDLDKFLSLSKDSDSIFKVIASGHNPHDTIMEAFEAIGKKVKAVMLHLKVPQKKAIEATSELAAQYCFCADTKFYWTLTLKQEKIYLILYYIK